MGVLIGETELREQLLRQNDEFRRLAAEHQSYAEQLDQLNRRHHLSDEELLQEVNLKKMKLHLKDQMYALMQKYRRELESHD